MRRAVPLLASLLALPGCAAERVQPVKPAVRPAVGASRADAGPALVPGPPRADDALWQRAAGRDPIDLQALADREGAAVLLAAVERGGDVGLTALAALPYADDAELALARLCQLSELLSGAPRHSVLVALQSVAAAIEPGGERLAGGELAGCDAALARVATDAKLPPGDRDLAASVRAALGEHLEPPPPP